MNTQLKNKIINSLKSLKEDRKLDPLFIQLDNGNYFLEVAWENDVWNDWMDETENIPLCYLYNFELIENRSDLRSRLKPTTPPNTRLQMAKDFALMSITLGNFYMTNLFKEIYNLIAEYDEFQEISIKDMNIEGGVAFLINGLKIMKFNAHDWDRSIDYGFTEEEYLDKLHIQTDINNICEQPFFKKLHNDSQFYLKAATQLLEIVYDSSRKELFDYSPLLVNFIKAIENETRELFLIYKSDILSLTPGMVSKIKSINNNSNKELLRLADFCKIINNHSTDYQPSGLKPLFFLFKYFFLREKSELTGVSKDIIQPHKKEILVKDANIIDEIFRKGEIRNDLIHKRIIDSKTEFFWHYNDLYSILQIIASIK